MRFKLPAWQTLAAKPAFYPVLLALAATVLFAPFLNRAFNIDEPLFLWTAKQIRQHPFDPYGFKVPEVSVENKWEHFHFNGGSGSMFPSCRLTGGAKIERYQQNSTLPMVT